MTRRLRVAPRASGQIEEASAWRFSHRPMAPRGFAEDLEQAFELIRSTPGVGQPVEHPRYPAVRRVLLGRSRYHLYYRESDDVIEVVALWHASRGGDPHL
ncbi:MAG: type II toxin-antitoxin system RelE/ParE family toxin [Candidatus Latescibacterota bacterium]